MTAGVRPPAGIASSIVPWRLPVPDSHGSPQYRQVIERIYAFSETKRSREQVALAQRRKLDRMRGLLSFLGTPQAWFSTILVAGTKGKGSTAALLASILTAAGYRVGRYTQPHLYSYRERTWALGEYISEIALQDAFDAMEEALDTVGSHADELGPLTTFDVGTALTLLHFARARVQIAVVEVGVGGANDATNALEPILSIIGPVGLDHVEILGSSVRGVALQKFGVARRGYDLLVGKQEAEARDALREAAARDRVRLHELGGDGDIGWTAASRSAGPFNVTGPGGNLEELETPLIGGFQRDNAALAVAAAQLLSQQGWPVSVDAMRGGLAKVHWPGRFQTVVSDPLTIVDGAHNPTATRALAATVRDYLPGRPVTLVVGMSDSKEIGATLAELAPVAQRALLTRSGQWAERSANPEDLLTAARSLGLEATIAPAPARALLQAWERQPSNAVTLVTGSLFVVGDVLEWLWQMQSSR